MDRNRYDKYGADAGFLNFVGNALSDAIFVVNKDIEIVYHNREFAKIFNEPDRQLLGKGFGATIGCKGHEKNYPDDICNNCKLRLTLLATIISESNQEKQSVVMEMEPGNKEELRLIQFKSNYLDYKGEKFAVVVLNDLTQMGNETLAFINRFYDDMD